jgi:hypothetical protein
MRMSAVDFGSRSIMGGGSGEGARRGAACARDFYEGYS